MGAETPGISQAGRCHGDESKMGFVFHPWEGLLRSRYYQAARKFAELHHHSRTASPETSQSREGVPECSTGKSAQMEDSSYPVAARIAGARPLFPLSYSVLWR